MRSADAAAKTIFKAGRAIYCWSARIVEATIDPEAQTRMTMKRERGSTYGEW